MHKLISIEEGVKIGKLYVIKFIEKQIINNNYYKLYLCRCECGKEKIIKNTDLKSGRVNSCGCIKKTTARQNTFVDITGQTFGNLTVINEAYSKNNYIYWNCLCVCGNIKIARGNLLRLGKTKSCGCLKKQNSYFQKGENHPQFIKTINKEEREKRRLSIGYNEWRQAVYKKYNYRCVLCNSNKNIHAHHLNGYVNNIEERLDVNNGIVLCKKHHIKFHTECGKGNNTKMQFSYYKEEKEHISLEFDGVIYERKEDNDGNLIIEIEPTEPPMPGALDFINWLVDNDYKIVVFSLRATREGGASGIYRWLEKNNFPVKHMKITAIKQPADLFIDDKAYRFTGNFNEIKTFIKKNITE